MEAVTDAQDRDSAAPDSRVRMRRACLVHARRSAREDDRSRLAGRDLTPWGVERQQLRVDVQLAHAPRDQLAVLAPEVQDDDRIHTGRDNWIHGAPFAQCRPPLLWPDSSRAGSTPTDADDGRRTPARTPRA